MDDPQTRSLFLFGAFCFFFLFNISFLTNCSNLPSWIFLPFFGRTLGKTTNWYIYIMQVCSDCYQIIFLFIQNSKQNGSSVPYLPSFSHASSTEFFNSDIEAGFQTNFLTYFVLLLKILIAGGEAGGVCAKYFTSSKIKPQYLYLALFCLQAQIFFYSGRENRSEVQQM